MSARGGTTSSRSLALAGRVAKTTAVLVSVAVYLVTQVSIVVLRPGWSVTDFRNFFSYDAYGYMTIVKNTSDGRLAVGEPSTETGHNFYPHSYYSLLGLVARIFGANPIAVWNVVGILVQVGLIVVIAVVLIGMTGRWWCGLLAPLPFMIGTFAWVRDPGSWYATLDSHAVIWGTFAVLFTLNGEAFALSAGAAMLLALMWLWLRPHSARKRLWLTALLCLGLGCLANVQTYSFLTVVYVLVFVVATWAVVTQRNWWIAGASVLLVPVVYVLGPIVNTYVGQLATLVFGLTPAIPGLVVLVLRTRARVLLPFAALVVGAAPQMLWVVYGIATHDPFLTYRVASNTQLGVPYVAGVVSGLALVVPLLVILAAGVVFRRPIWFAYGFGASVAWFLLAFNDRWGANAEPYRLWIDGFAVISIVTLPMLVDVATGRSRRTERTGSAAGDAVPERPRAAARPWQPVATTVAIVLCACLAVASSVDWVRFFVDDADHTSTSFLTSPDLAASTLAMSVSHDSRQWLTTTDPCVDPRVLKINSGVPVAFYFIGMAWPTHRNAVQAVMDSRQAGKLDFTAAREAHVKWVVTDSRCRTNWASKYASHLDRVSSASYDNNGVSGRITIWKIVSPDSGN